MNLKAERSWRMGSSAKDPVRTLVISWGSPRAHTGSSVILRNLARCFSPDEMQIVSEPTEAEDAALWPSDCPQVHIVDPFVSWVKRGRSTARWLRVGGVVRQVNKIARQMGAERILTLFPDDYHLYVGYRCSKDLGIPLYTWFHNTYLDAKQGYRKVIARWLQPAVFRHSRLNMVMSDGMLEFMSRRYPGVKFATLQHGFPLPAANPELVDGRMDLSSSGRIRFCYTGNLNQSCEDSTRRLVAALTSRPNFELHVHSPTPRAYWQRLGVDLSRVIFHPPTSALGGFEKLLAQYDVLLLALGLTGSMPAAEYQTIFPTRTIPLLCSGRPILAHVTPGSFLARFLEERACAFVADRPVERHLLETVDSMIADPGACKARVLNAITASKYFDVEHVREKLRSLLREH